MLKSSQFFVLAFTLVLACMLFRLLPLTSGNRFLEFGSKACQAGAVMTKTLFSAIWIGALFLTAVIQAIFPKQYRLTGIILSGFLFGLCLLYNFLNWSGSVCL